MDTTYAAIGQTWINPTTGQPEVIDRIIQAWTAQADTIITRDRQGIQRVVTRTALRHAYTLSTVNPQF